MSIWHWLITERRSENCGKKRELKMPTHNNKRTGNDDDNKEELIFIIVKDDEDEPDDIVENQRLTLLHIVSVSSVLYRFNMFILI
jgi:hypothetical protein